MTAARAALVQMLGARLVALAATMVGFAVLARLLTPEDFGNFAIAIAAFQVAKNLTAFGLRQYLVSSARAADEGDLATAAGLSSAIAVAGCLLFVLASALGGGALSEPIAAALLPLGLALLARPLILGTEVQLQRAMSFRLQAGAAVLATLAETAAAIVLAVAGFGTVALATGILASEVLTAVVLLAFGGRENRTWPRRFARSDLRIYFGFGSRLSTINLLPSLVNMLLISALSGFAGPAVTGFYNRAKSVPDLLDRIIFEGVSPVILPMLSGALRNGMPLSRVLAIKLDYMAALCWPALALIGILAEPLILVLLGPQWDAAVPALRILALSGLALPFTKMSVKLFTAIGALDAYLRIQVAFHAVALVMGVLAAMVSLEAFCAAITLALIFKAAAISLWLQRRHGGESTVLPPLARGAALTAATVALPALLVMASGLGPLPLLLAALPLAGLVWLAGLFALRHPLAEDLRAIAAVPARRMAFWTETPR